MQNYYWWVLFVLPMVVNSCKNGFHGFLIVLMIDLLQIFSILLVGMVHDFENNLDMASKKKEVCFARSVTK